MRSPHWLLRLMGRSVCTTCKRVLNDDSWLCVDCKNALAKALAETYSIEDFEAILCGLRRR